MIPKGLFTQLFLLIISVAIVFTYIKPAFTVIGETQDKVVRYQSERGKVQEVNQELSNQVSRLENVSTTDHRKLLTYMPDEVDNIAVMRDLYLISESAGVIFNDVVSEASAQAQTRPSRRSAPAEDSLPDEEIAHQHPFVLSVEGSYNQIKNLLSLLEQNEYPLEVHSLNLTSNEGGFLSADLRVVTYTHLPPTVTEKLYE